MHSAGKTLMNYLCVVYNASYPIIVFKHFSDELPVQLMLPKAIQEAKNRQQLSSLALLGQG